MRPTGARLKTYFVVRKIPSMRLLGTTLHCILRQVSRKRRIKFILHFGVNLARLERIKENSNRSLRNFFDLPVTMRHLALVRMRRTFSKSRLLVSGGRWMFRRRSSCGFLIATIGWGRSTRSSSPKQSRLIDSYVFRRAISGEQTRGYWQVFANLAYSIDPKRPSEALAVGLARQRDNYRFPNDDEFRRALEEQDIYGKRVCFDLLEAAGSDQDHDREVRTRPR